MDIKNIYENIDIDELAEYQIKVKGDIDLLKKLIRQMGNYEITSETADTDYQICMIRTTQINQRYLFKLIGLLIQKHYAVVSIICSNIPKKNNADEDTAIQTEIVNTVNDSDLPSARTA